MVNYYELPWQDTLRKQLHVKTSSWVHAKILSPCFISGFTGSYSWAIEQKVHTGASLFYIVCYDDSLLDDQNQFVFVLARLNWRSGNYHQDQVGSGVTKLNLFYTCCRRVIEFCDTWRRVVDKNTAIFPCHWKACSGDQITMKPTTKVPHCWPF